MFFEQFIFVFIKCISDNTRYILCWLTHYTPPHIHSQLHRAVAQLVRYNDIIINRTVWWHSGFL